MREGYVSPSPLSAGASDLNAAIHPGDVANDIKNHKYVMHIMIVAGSDVDPAATAEGPNDASSKDEGR